VLKAGESKEDGSCNNITYDIAIKVNLEIRCCFEVRHPRYVGSITKNFCVLHNTVEHNYISPSSTVGIQLHF